MRGMFRIGLAGMVCGIVAVSASALGAAAQANLWENRPYTP